MSLDAELVLDLGTTCGDAKLRSCWEHLAEWRVMFSYMSRCKKWYLFLCTRDRIDLEVN